MRAEDAKEMREFCIMHGLSTEAERLRARIASTRELMELVDVLRDRAVERREERLHGFRL